MSDGNLKKPTEFKLAIQGGMLAALGINMYSTVGTSAHCAKLVVR